LLALSRRLPVILRGEENPRDSTERLTLAQMAYDRAHFTAAARLWAESFQMQPKLADDMQLQNRYNAACAAALAGSGQGKDDPPLDEAAKARWRRQAIEWLNADLVFWTKQVEKGPQQTRVAVSQTLQHWKADTDLAGLRDEAALAKLPDEERKAWQVLWGEVDGALRKAMTK
jgi:eukaryotic-like serine/threonine-protein kinase